MPPLDLRRFFLVVLWNGHQRYLLLLGQGKEGHGSFEFDGVFNHDCLVRIDTIHCCLLSHAFGMLLGKDVGA